MGGKYSSLLMGRGKKPGLAQSNPEFKGLIKFFEPNELGLVNNSKILAKMGLELDKGYSARSGPTHPSPNKF